jgi:hypothetical protein
MTDHTWNDDIEEAVDRAIADTLEAFGGEHDEGERAELVSAVRRVFAALPDAIRPNVEAALAGEQGAPAVVRRLMADPDFREELRTAMRDLEEGRAVPLSEVALAQPVVAGEPRTEAGKALVEEMVKTFGMWPDGSHRRHFSDRIVAIEAEAAQPDAAVLALDWRDHDPFAVKVSIDWRCKCGAVGSHGWAGYGYHLIGLLERREADIAERARREAVKPWREALAAVTELLALRVPEVGDPDDSGFDNEHEALAAARALLAEAE